MIEYKNYIIIKDSRYANGFKIRMTILKPNGKGVPGNLLKNCWGGTLWQLSEKDAKLYIDELTDNSHPCHRAAIMSLERDQRHILLGDYYD